MKLNRPATRLPKAGFIGFKLDEATAASFKNAARKDGGISAVLRRFVQTYLRRRKAA